MPFPTFILPQPPFDPNQPPPPCPPWNSHEGMWNDQRDQGNWSGAPPREGGPWSGPGGSEQGPPSWNSYDQQPPWGNQPDQPPWGQREPPFPPRMQVCDRCVLWLHFHTFSFTALYTLHLPSMIALCSICFLLPIYLIDYNVYVCFYRGLPISEGLSLPTSNHLLLTSLLHHRTILDASHLVLCRMTFLPDTTMTGHHIPHIALTMLREIMLEV